jgi:hypothetical protein
MGCAIRRTPGALSNRRALGPFLLLVAVWVASSVTTVWAQAEVYLYVDLDGDGVKDETTLSATTPAIQGKTPVLFVHGHNLLSPNDTDFSFRKNWHDPHDGLPSFKQTLDLPENAWLNIEPYYIRFQDQNRSIVEDAREIGWAVEHILHRHDPSHVPFTQNPSSNIKVAIIGYSKGTISSRLYLKSLHEQQYDLPAPRPGFNPVSEFIAIAPPNHGLAAGVITAFSLALKQLNNGYRDDCTQYVLDTAESQDFIETLNGHNIEDSQPPSPPDPNWSLGEFPTEARGSRSNGSPTSAGTLYATLYANSDATGVARDFVGGHYPSNDCQGRVLARNLAPHAENIEVSAIPGQDSTNVHINTVHTPEVICLALYAVALHRVPNNPSTFACKKIRQIPLIPRPLWWWWRWWIILALVAMSLIPWIYWLRRRRMARLGP